MCRGRVGGIGMVEKLMKYNFHKIALQIKSYQDFIERNCVAPNKYLCSEELKIRSDLFKYRVFATPIKPAVGTQMMPHKHTAVHVVEDHQHEFPSA